MYQEAQQSYVQKFQEIGEAKEILLDTEKRRIYDRGGEPDSPFEGKE